MKIREQGAMQTAFIKAKDLMVKFDEELMLKFPIILKLKV